jgi:hypothetical protein
VHRQSVSQPRSFKSFDVCLMCMLKWRCTRQRAAVAAAATSAAVAAVYHIM